MKQLTMTVLALFLVATMNAQVENDWLNKMKQEQENTLKSFEQFKEQAYQEYENFRKKANEDYAKFMEEAWKSLELQPAETAPEKPKPPQPDIVDAPTAAPDLTRPVVEPIRVPDPVQPSLSVPEIHPNTERPQPVEPITITNPLPVAVTRTVDLYGSKLPFHYETPSAPQLKDNGEKSVAAMWKVLSAEDYDYIISECLQKREERNLCDWAYIKLTQNVAESHCGKGTDEAIVMQMYLLTQSGYQMRIARCDGRLTILIGSYEKLYGRRYYTMEGVRFYVIDKSVNKKGMEIFDHAFPGEKPFSLELTQPKLTVAKTEERTLVSKRYPEVIVTIQTNKNLINFYNDYPLNDRWENYSKASISSVLKESLYPALRKAIEGKNELEAANILLNFVQTGFEYKTDDKQFGYERPLFPDETFYYPYCDCEDRSILFSCLVRELLGLEVVLLDYPEHIATAVCFKQPVEGDYLVADGKNFIISDPTYIGAQVGMCAPKYKTVSPKLVKF